MKQKIKQKIKQAVTDLYAERQKQAVTAFFVSKSIKNEFY